jgi:glucose/mannose-6-phosphate isomerase
MPRGLQHQLDDVARTQSLDAADMLAAVGSAAEQIRTVRAGLSGGRRPRPSSDLPRAVIVAGMGGSAAAGDLMASVVAATARVPVHVHRGYGLPTWACHADAVLAVSCSGSTEETLDAVAQARSLGARLYGAGADGSPLADAVRSGGGRFVGVDAEGRQPRACLWSLSVPLLTFAAELGLVKVPAAVYSQAAAALDEVVERCGPDVPAVDNPAKSLARSLADGLPVLWGFSPVAGVAAVRFANQLAENAELLAVVGAMPEAHHNQVVAFDNPNLRGRLVLLRDCQEQPQLVRRAEETRRLAIEAGLPVREVHATGVHPLTRAASLIGLLDYASVYVALERGVDPTPVAPITTLKLRMTE